MVKGDEDWGGGNLDHGWLDEDRNDCDEHQPIRWRDCAPRTSSACNIDVNSTPPARPVSDDDCGTTKLNPTVATHLNRHLSSGSGEVRGLRTAYRSSRGVFLGFAMCSEDEDTSPQSWDDGLT
jgi:hypothetical protein